SVRRACGMNDREMALLPKRLKRSQRGMQPEEAVEIDHRLTWNVDAGPHRVVLRLAVGNDDVQSVSRTALEDDDKTLSAAPIFQSPKSCARKKAGNSSCADDSKRSIAKKDTASGGHMRLRATSVEMQVRLAHDS